MTLAANNPGNLRPLSNGQLWEGQTGSLNGFCVFDTLENGVRALCKTLLTYQDVHDLNCVFDWINRWAPPSENDTAAYIKDVSERTGWWPEEFVDLRIQSNLVALANAICVHETGAHIDPLVIAAGASAALG